MVGATAWIERMKLEPGFGLAGVTRALVVGGGNTAIDAARELARLGVPEVAMVYRRESSDMPGYRHEMDAARREGVRLIEKAVPKAVLRDQKGRLTALQLTNGQELAADLVVLGIGQAKLRDLAQSFAGVKLDEKGRIVADPKTGQTGNAKVLAGGDALSGGELVVNWSSRRPRRASGRRGRSLGRWASRFGLTLRFTRGTLDGWSSARDRVRYRSGISKRYHAPCGALSRAERAGARTSARYLFPLPGEARCCARFRCSPR